MRGIWEFLALALVAVLLIGAGVRMFLASRTTAAQRERRRRDAIHRTGRMGEAYVIDVRESVVYYSYELRGVAYTTSQDVSEFLERLPADSSLLIGPAGMKYLPGDPANSIVICDAWNGLRHAPVEDSSTPKEITHT
jgi:hypothetical protein